MVIVGRMMWKHCPKHINGMLGYRTTRSMKNMDTWKFAHDYCGKLWWKIGWVMILPSALIHIPLYHSDENTIGVAGGILVTIQCIILIVSIYPTEKVTQITPLAPLMPKGASAAASFSTSIRSISAGERNWK